VAWQCCVAAEAPRTENIEVEATHLGYGHHHETLRVIADRLAQPEGQWTPYADRASDPATTASAPDGATPHDRTAHDKAG
jgi:hypothetical protein